MLPNRSIEHHEIGLQIPDARESLAEKPGDDGARVVLHNHYDIGTPSVGGITRFPKWHPDKIGADCF